MITLEGIYVHTTLEGIYDNYTVLVTLYIYGELMATIAKTKKISNTYTVQNSHHKIIENSIKVFVER